jgi:hypothetical protein
VSTDAFPDIADAMPLPVARSAQFKINNDDDEDPYRIWNADGAASVVTASSTGGNIQFVGASKKENSLLPMSFTFQGRTVYYTDYHVLNRVKKLIPNIGKTEQWLIDHKEHVAWAIVYGTVYGKGIIPVQWQSKYGDDLFTAEFQISAEETPRDIDRGTGGGKF